MSTQLSRVTGGKSWKTITMDKRKTLWYCYPMHTFWLNVIDNTGNSVQTVEEKERGSINRYLHESGIQTVIEEFNEPIQKCKEPEDWL